MTAGPDLLMALNLAVRALEISEVPYAAIGGLARNAWGTARTTTDLDFEIEVDPATLARAEECLIAEGLLRERHVGPSDPDDQVPDIVVYRSPPPSFVRIDLLLAKTPFQSSAILRRVPVDLFGVRMWVVKPEDLVVYKLIAFRGRDQDDIKDVLTTQVACGHPLDAAYITHWAEEWGITQRWLLFRGTH